MTWEVRQADVLDFFAAMEPDSVDLVFGSPPYEDARTYGIDFDKIGQAWVDWMVEVYRAASLVCKGLVAFVVDGKTNDFRYSCTPALLMADLHRAGFNLRRPCFFHRVGIPGSGGPDWLRGDTEFIVCVTRPGKLAWSDNTAMGHIPKWGPGGEMSYRQANGKRQKKGRPSHMIGPNGEKVSSTKGNRIDKRIKDGSKTGSELQAYAPPVLANPGNVIFEANDFVHCNVGGGVMGESNLCHRNEAPFPEALAEFFVQSFCPPGGLVVDPFTGSGTVGVAATRHGRRFLGCDVRPSQIALARKRLALVTPLGLFSEKA